MQCAWTAAIFGLIVAVAGARAATTEQFQETMRPLAADCKEQTEANDEDVEAFVNLEGEYTDNGKCMLKCVLEKLTAVKDDKFVAFEDNVQNYQTLLSFSEERLPKVQEIVTVCKSEAEEQYPDQVCNAAHNVVVCMSTKEFE